MSEGQEDGNGDATGLVGQVVNAKNLVLLRKSDRLAVPGAACIEEQARIVSKTDRHHRFL